MDEINKEDYMNYWNMKIILGGSFYYEFDEGAKLTLTGYRDSREVQLDFDNMDEDTYEQLNVSDTDVKYDDAMRIIHGSKRYEFNDSELTVAVYYSGDEVKLNLDRITEKMFKKLYCTEELDDDFSYAVNSIETGNDIQM